jgi:phosphatidylglycerophosphate synthase
MGFWSEYWSTTKPLDVEEPIDIWVHRPLGYVIAKLVRATPITPNQITLLSILFALLAGICFSFPFPFHLPLGGAALVFSAALDCADGMLARMRKSSSELGRMLDGVADMVSAGAAIVGGTVIFLRIYGTPRWHALIALALAGATVYTGSFHTTGYDHYKNVFLRMTLRGSREGESVGDATVRFEKAKAAPMGLVARVSFAVYFFYIRSQREFVKQFDPYGYADIDEIPPFDERRAAIYRKHALPAMRLWRSFFGLGSLLFGIAVFGAFGRTDVYMLLRLFGLNGVYYLYLAPLQRRASREARAEMDALPVLAQPVEAHA